MWYFREPPIDRNQVEQMSKQVLHDPSQWSQRMLKVMIGFGTLGGVLLIWAIISLARGN